MLIPQGIRYIFRTSSSQRLNRLWTLCLIVSFFSLSLSTSACFPEGPESEAGTEEGSEESGLQSLAADEEVAETQSVIASLQTARTEGGSFGLVSDIRDVAYQLVGCKSGYGSTLNTFSLRTLSLYRFDRGCQIQVVRVNISGIDYQLPSGTPFQGQLNAMNSFVNTSGQTIYLKVLSQLPAVLETSAYAVSFLLSESVAGTNLTHTIYEVGVSSNVSQISESSSAAATITVQRAAPATTALEVNLSYEGDATSGIDTNALPSKMTLAAGQSSKTFTISAINDNTYEGTEFIRVRVAPGINYLPKNQYAEVDILDDDIAFLVFDAPLYNFGSRANNLPHSLRVKLTNTGRAPATQIQLLSPLTAPFIFPGGFPGDNANCGTVLPAGQFCYLTVGFNPSNTSILNSTLTLSYFDSAMTSQVQTSLRGNGATAAYLTLSDVGAIEFPSQPAGQAIKKHIIVKNSGGASASALGGSFSSNLFNWAGGNFPGTGGNCSSSLSAAAQCTIVLSFAAPTAGFYEGSFSLSYNNGSQVLSQSLGLEASINALIAKASTYTTGLNQTRALTLSALGGSGAISFEVLNQPRFGTLAGTPPNLSYTPAANFTGSDSFTFRAIDASGPSMPASIRIMVRPRALFIVGSFSLENVEQSIITRLNALGFAVTSQDDNLSTVNDANQKELLLFSRSARRNRYQNKFYDSPVPAVVWDKTDMTEMRMLSGSSGTYSGRQVRITNAAHPIASGMAATVQTVFSSNEALAYGITNSANAQTIAVNPNNSAQAVIFGYEERNYLPGNMVAPARRLATSLPNDDDTLTAIGWTLFNQSIAWLMQGSTALLDESFQRDASLSLGKAWQENENGYPGVFQIAGDQLQINSAVDLASAKLPLPLQTSGSITWSFYLDLKKGSAAPANYLQEFQLGRCDLMDKNLPTTSGAAVHLVWGGTASGLAGEEFLGTKIGNVTSSLSQVNQRKAPISVEVDLTNKRYTVKLPNGTVSPAINFDSQVAIDCMRLTSRNINSSGFTYRGIDQIKIIPGR